MNIHKSSSIEARLSRPLVLRGGKYVSADAEVSPSVGAEARDLYSKLQHLIKRFPTLYAAIVDYLSPVLSSVEYRRVRRRFFSLSDEGLFVVNHGSGPVACSRHPNVVNIDISPYEGVDIVSSVPLPLLDNTVDVIISQAVLEHVADPASLIDEFHRCIRPGGKLLVYVPFIQPSHAAPGDFSRWTCDGLINLCSRFRCSCVGVGAGPTSAMLWVFQSWFCSFISLGDRRVQSVLMPLIMTITAPVKYLDLFFPGTSIYPTCSAYYAVFEKS